MVLMGSDTYPVRRDKNNIMQLSTGMSVKESFKYRKNKESMPRNPDIQCKVQNTTQMFNAG